MTDFEYMIFEELCDNECCVMNIISDFDDAIMRMYLYHIEYEKTIADLSAWGSDPHLRLKSRSTIQRPESFLRSSVKPLYTKMPMTDFLGKNRFSWISEDEKVQLAKFITSQACNKTGLFN